jgi:hypothetical protein
MIEREIPLMGHLAFPFIGQGKDLGYTRERKTEKEIVLGLCCPSPP